MDNVNNHIREAVAILRQGGIVIFPTDTAFGIGCRMDDRTAVDRLFGIRNRPRTQATPVLVASEAMAARLYRSVTPVMRALMQRYWPGALTIIGTCRQDAVYEPVRGGTDTIGIRMPDHTVPLALIGSLDVPLLGPSANFHGESTPYRDVEVDPDLVKLADYFIPGVCRESNVSTVVDCTVEPYRIVRQGAVRFPHEL